jgi:hypothetical protein
MCLLRAPVTCWYLAMCSEATTMTTKKLGTHTRMELDG